MGERIDQVIYEVKDFNKQVDILPGSRPVRDGYWGRIVLRTMPNGTRKVLALVRKHTSGCRASGNQYGYWSTERSQSIYTTKAGLVVSQVLDGGVTVSGHLFAGDDIGLTCVRRFIGRLSGNPFRRHHAFEISTEEQARLATLISEFIGALPVRSDRFPLFPDDAEYTAALSKPYLDAGDFAQVAKNMFGVKAYRKPLAVQVERLGPEMCGWFTLFRGLVPTEWIVEAMAALTPGLIPHWDATTMREIRRILVRTPREVIRRILKENPHVVSRALRDAANVALFRDLDQLPNAIAARGQRHIRGVRELERAVDALPHFDPKRGRRARAVSRALRAESLLLTTLTRYNTEFGESISWEAWKSDAALREQADERLEAHFAARMDAEQRERVERQRQRHLERLERERERADWATGVAAALDGAKVAGLTARVAADASTLKRWGSEMGNCIGGYDGLLGLDVFVSLTDPATGKMLLNLQITQSDGLVQCLGKFNENADRVLPSPSHALKIMEEFEALGVPTSPNCWGLQHLITAAA